MGLTARPWEVEQDGVVGAAGGVESGVGVELADQAGQGFGAGVVLQPEPDLPVAAVAVGVVVLGPDAVPVGVNSLPDGCRRPGWSPPAGQLGARVGAAVGEEVDEHLVGAVGVGQVGAGGDRFDPVAPGSWCRCGAALVDGVVAGREQSGDPVGLAVLAGADGGEPVHPAQVPQPVEAGPGGGRGVEQDGGQLAGGQGAVLDEQGGDDVVAGLELVDDGRALLDGWLWSPVREGALLRACRGRPGGVGSGIAGLLPARMRQRPSRGRLGRCWGVVGGFSGTCRGFVGPVDADADHQARQAEGRLAEGALRPPTVGVEAPGGPQWPRLASARTLNALADAPGVQVLVDAGSLRTQPASTGHAGGYGVAIRSVKMQNAAITRAAVLDGPRVPLHHVTRVPAAVRAPRAQRRG